MAAHPNEMNKRIMGRDLLMIVCAALNIDPTNVARVVLDIPFSGRVTVYVELIGSMALIGIDWPGALHEAEIRIAGDEQHGG